MEFWRQFPAGYSGIYTFPFAWDYDPCTIFGVRSARGDRSFDRELCVYNVTTTSCEFKNLTPLGGQGGWLYAFQRVK